MDGELAIWSLEGHEQRESILDEHSERRNEPYLERSFPSLCSQPRYHVSRVAGVFPA